jgi:hypothetical protein
MARVGRTQTGRCGRLRGKKEWRAAEAGGVPLLDRPPQSVVSQSSGLVSGLRNEMAGLFQELSGASRNFRSATVAGAAPEFVRLPNYPLRSFTKWHLEHPQQTMTGPARRP